MCNDYRNRISARRLAEAFSAIGIPLHFANGVPNLEPRDDIRITDRAPIVRPDGDGARLDMMRWSWPSPNGAPVFNFRSESRSFERAKRCLIPADGFYEFTAPRERKEKHKDKHKDKWLFTMNGTDLFGIAGVWRAGAAKGEDAWTMLTCAPGPDVAPYHDRQVVVLAPDKWAAWLGGTGNEREILVPSPAGTLTVERQTP
jgi:putative SOS response-associated peptidase YedK